MEEFIATVSAVVDDAPCMIWLCSASQTYSHINERFLRFTGRKLSDELGRECLAGVHPSDAAKVQRIIAKELSGGKGSPLDFNLRGADGEYHWMLGYAHPLRGASGQFGLIGACCEGPASRKQNKEIKASTAILRLAASSLAKLCDLEIRAPPTVSADVDEFVSRVVNKLAALNPRREVEKISSIEFSLAFDQEIVDCALSLMIAACMHQDLSESGAVLLKAAMSSSGRELEFIVTCQRAPGKFFSGKGYPLHHGFQIVQRLLAAVGGALRKQETPDEFLFVISLFVQDKRGGSPDRNGTYNILVVDDNHVNRVVLGGMLDALSMNYTSMASGEGAIKVAAKEKFDLIFMDCHMPGMDGYEATQTILTQDPTVPIVAVTADQNVSNKQKCEDVGMVGFLAKPYSFQDLRDHLSKYLGDAAYDDHKRRRKHSVRSISFPLVKNAQTKRRNSASGVKLLSPRSVPDNIDLETGGKGSRMLCAFDDQQEDLAYSQSYSQPKLSSNQFSEKIAQLPAQITALSSQHIKEVAMMFEHAVGQLKTQLRGCSPTVQSQVARSYMLLHYELASSSGVLLEGILKIVDGIETLSSSYSKMMSTSTDEAQLTTCRDCRAFVVKNNFCGACGSPLGSKQQPPAEPAVKFFSAVAHDLRNILHGVVGMSDTLQMTSLTPAQERMCASLSKSVFSLQEMLSSFLDFTKLQNNVMVLETSSTTTMDILNAFIESNAEAVMDKGLDFVVDIDLNIPSVIEIDQKRTLQIVSLLLRNAINHTAGGQVVLRCHFRRGNRSKITLVLEVADTGTIPPEHHADLLSTFGPPSSEPGASVLDLPLVTALTKQMRGEVSFDSDAGQGSVFRVSLPAKALRAVALVEGLKSSPNKQNVLVVDSCNEIREVIVRTLEQLGHTVEAVSTKEQAHAAVMDRRAFNLILLSTADPMAPDGFLAELVQAGLAHAVRLFVEPAVEVDYKDELATMGVQAILKPITPFKIFAALGNTPPSSPRESEKVEPFAARPVGEPAARKRNKFQMLRKAGPKSGASHTRSDSQGSKDSNKDKKSSRALQDETVRPADKNNAALPHKEKVLAPQAETDDKEYLWKVLVADDRKENLVLATRMLSFLQVRSYTVQNGKDAFDLVREHKSEPFHLVIMDVSMPVMDGYKAIELIRAFEQQENLVRTPIVGFTAFDSAMCVERLMNSGADDILPKPTRLVDIKRLLGKFVPAFAPSPSRCPLVPMETSEDSGVLKRVDNQSDVLAWGRRVDLLKQRGVTDSADVVLPPPYNILITDDQPVSQEVLSWHLSSLGYSFITAEDGEEAVEVVAMGLKEHATPIDLILMDIRMPKMDGLEATRRVRLLDAEHNRRTVIVCMSASSLPDDRQACLAVGADDFLDKPISRQELSALLQRWVDASLVASGEKSETSHSMMSLPWTPSANWDPLISEDSSLDVSPFVTAFMSSEASDARPKTPNEEDGNPLTMSWTKGTVLGVGGCSSVYIGQDQRDGSLMAVKEITMTGQTTQELKRRLSNMEREMQMMQQLSHPNVVKYLGSEVQRRDDVISSVGGVVRRKGFSASLFIFMEYIPGGTLASLVHLLGSFSEPVARTYTTQILNGIKYLHEQQIAHCDIKGGNILVAVSDDKKEVCKVSDFGYASYVKDMTGMVGTPQFMAPEMVKKESPGLAADVWSLGATVMQMLTGHPPWHKLKSTEVLGHIRNIKQGPDAPPNVRPQCADFLKKCFSVDPTQRATAEELLQHPWIVGGEDQELLQPSPDLRVPRVSSRMCITHDTSSTDAEES